MSFSLTSVDGAAFLTMGESQFAERGWPSAKDRVSVC
jgi:hypothetical protein